MRVIYHTKSHTSHDVSEWRERETHSKLQSNCSTIDFFNKLVTSHLKKSELKERLSLFIFSKAQDS